jgi:hypothetical protein
VFLLRSRRAIIGVDQDIGIEKYEFVGRAFCSFATSFALVKLLAIEFPASRVAAAAAGEILEGGGIPLWIAFPGQLLQVLADELVHALSGCFGTLSSELKHIVVDGEGEVHKHRISAHVTSVKPLNRAD